MFAAPTTTQTVQDPIQAQGLAEPDALDGFDRSGHGVAQRRRAAILAGSSVQRKVVQRELEASRGAGTLSDMAETKLQQAIDTMNEMPFEEEIAITVDTADLPAADAPIATRLSSGHGKPTRFTIRADFVETRSVEEILSLCRRQLGEVVLPAAKTAKSDVQVPKEDVFLAEGDKLHNDGKGDTSALRAKLFDFLFRTELLVSQLTKSKSTESTHGMMTAMCDRLGKLTQEHDKQHPWISLLVRDPIRSEEVESGLQKHRAKQRA